MSSKIVQQQTLVNPEYHRFEVGPFYDDEDGDKLLIENIARLYREYKMLTNEVRITIYAIPWQRGPFLQPPIEPHRMLHVSVTLHDEEQVMTMEVQNDA